MPGVTIFAAARAIVDTPISEGAIVGAAIGALAKRMSGARLIFDYRGAKLIPTFHPAYLLRNPGDKRLVWQDIQQVMARLGLPVASSKLGRSVSR